MDLANGSIVGIRYPRPRGVVDVLDTEGRLHQLRIQLQPTSPQVSKVLTICRSILPESLGERIYAGWLHVTQWLEEREQDGTPANVEWSAVVILLFALFLNLGRVDAQSPQSTRLPVRKRRHASGSFAIRDSEDWKALEVGETANSLGCPPWMMNQGWQWALDEDMDDAMSAHGDPSSPPKFVAKHIGLAKDYMASDLGESALGAAGYLPTALSKNSDAKRKVALEIFMGLHLLLEEQKLDIMTPEYTSPGRADLRVALCQIARWLKWHNFSSIYELGIQEEIDPRHDLGMSRCYLIDSY